MSRRDEENRFDPLEQDWRRAEDQDSGILVQHEVPRESKPIKVDFNEQISSRGRNRSSVEMRDASLTGSERTSRFSSLGTRSGRGNSPRRNRFSSSDTRTRRISSPESRTRRVSSLDTKTRRVSHSSSTEFSRESLSRTDRDDLCTCIHKQNLHREFVLYFNQYCDCERGSR